MPLAELVCCCWVAEPRCIPCWDGEGLEKEGTGEQGGNPPPLGEGGTPPPPPGEGEEISW